MLGHSLAEQILSRPWPSTSTMPSCNHLSHCSSAVFGFGASRLLLHRGSAPSLCRCAASLGAVISSSNAIAAAATASSGPHAAVGSTLAHVAVTAVAMASGACLSTKVDFLWPRVEEQPDETERCWHQTNL